MLFCTVLVFEIQFPKRFWFDPSLWVMAPGKILTILVVGFGLYCKWEINLHLLEIVGVIFLSSCVMCESLGSNKQQGDVEA